MLKVPGTHAFGVATTRTHTYRTLVALATASALVLAHGATASAQVKAFPTAEGAGALSRADTPYELYEVTNLDSSGPGSLWNALGDDRIIVFRVSGIIDIPTTNTRSFKNTIVLGQTAPEPGITVVGNGWRWSGVENAIFRYIRFRTWQCRGDLNEPCGVDNIDVAGLGEVNRNIIFDHCSFGFGGDEFLSFRGDTHTATVQHCLFAYGKTGMLAGDSDDTSRGYDFSILHNFWHTIGKRTPNPNSDGRIDVIGNVTYNILNLGMRTGGSLQLNEIGNAYRRASRHKLSFGGDATPKVHTSNNRYGDTITANGQDNTVLWESWLDGRDPEPGDFVDTPFPLLDYSSPLPDGDDALLLVENREHGANAYLDDSGNPVLGMDALDTTAYEQFDDGVYFDWDDGTGNRTQGSWKLIPERQWLIANQDNFGVVINEHDQATHTGVVPNVWITSRGLDPGTFDPLGNDLDPVYTNIEVYSFGVDGSSSPPDGETPDAGMPDGGTSDAGTSDAGASDAGAPDSGAPGDGTPDAGAPDAGSADAGSQGGTPPGDAPPETETQDSGCSSTGGSTLPSPWMLLLAMLGLGTRRRRA